MKYILTTVTLALVLLPVGYAANGALTDEGRRLTGPFCIGKANEGENAGVVRSIAATQKCRDYEIRKLGIGWPSSVVTITQLTGSQANCVKIVSSTSGEGMRVLSATSGVICGTAGPAGANGKDGAPGANGINGVGTPGPKGDKGDKGDTGSAGTCECKPEICPIKDDDHEDKDKDH